MSTSKLGQRFPKHRFWRDVGMLVSGNVLASVVGLVVAGLSARDLGPTDFGKLALVAAAYMLTSRLLIVQSGPALISFGARAHAEGRLDLLSGLLRWCLRLELASAAFAATLFATSLALWSLLAAEPDQQLLMAALVAVVPLAVNVTSYSGAVLRLGGSFVSVAMQGAVANMVKLVGCAVAFWVLEEPSLVAYAIAWSLGDLAGVLLLAAAGRFAARRFAADKVASSAEVATEYPGLRSFVATGVAHNAVKSAVREGDILLVGALAGPSGAGAYRLIKQVGSALGRIVDPMQQAIYPMLANAVARRDLGTFVASLRTIALVTSLALLVVFGAFVLVGERLILLVLGPGFEAVFSGALIFIIGTAIAMISVGLHPAALALGMPLESFYVLTVSAVVYAFALTALVPTLGVNGAAAAYVIFYAIWAIQLWVRIRKHWKA